MLIWSYLAKTLSLSVLLKAESREVHAASEYLGLRKNTDTSNTIDLHLHVGVTVRVAKVGKMRAPCGIFCVALNNDSVLIKSVSQR